MVSTTQQCDLKASVISIGDKSQDHEYGVWLFSTFVTQGNAIFHVSKNKDVIFSHPNS